MSSSHWLLPSGPILGNSIVAIFEITCPWRSVTCVNAWIFMRWSQLWMTERAWERSKCACFASDVLVFIWSAHELRCVFGASSRYWQEIDTVGSSRKCLPKRLWWLRARATVWVQNVKFDARFFTQEKASEHVMVRHAEAKVFFFYTVYLVRLPLGLCKRTRAHGVAHSGKSIAW